jgi:hypothetical protein
MLARFIWQIRKAIYSLAKVNCLIVSDARATGTENYYANLARHISCQAEIILLIIKMQWARPTAIWLNNQRTDEAGNLSRAARFFRVKRNHFELDCQ